MGELSRLPVNLKTGEERFHALMPREAGSVVRLFLKRPGVGAIAAASLLAVGCSWRAPEARAQARQDWFHITLGVTDRQPAGWSGSIEVDGGRVVSLAPWRFDKDDRIEPQRHTWKCATRRAAVLNPKDWYVGAIHVVPKDMTPPPGAMIANGLYAAVEGASMVRVHTEQGSFQFQPAAVRFGEPERFLDGRVELRRVPAAANLTASSGLEDDYPSTAVDSTGAAWVAWVGYKSEKETLFVARADGSEKRAAAEGEFFRPALAADASGGLHVAVSVNTGATWRIGVVSRRGGAWGDIEIVSGGGPDISPRAAVDSKGRLWVVWQAYRQGRTRILARMRDGGGWQREIAVSENTHNAWEPSLAAGDAGRIHFAWDAYDGGDYNIWYRAHDGAQLLAVMRITTSPRLEAHASIACDRAGRPWIAYDEAGANWGKDTGFLVPKNNGATMLYDGRRLRLVVVDPSGPRDVEMPEGFLEQPQLAADTQGSLWLLARHRETKMHEVFSPSLGRMRMQQYSFWGYAAAHLAGGRWSPLVALPHSWGRNDLRASIAAAPGGRAALAWTGDGRVFSTPYPNRKSNVYSGEISGAIPAAPPLPPYRAPAATVNPVHPRESEQVARLQSARIASGGRQLRVFRGDMHRHTDLSFDGDLDGSLWDFYRYTIDAAAFDYSAVTEHNAGDDNEYFWWLIQKSNELFHNPGRFAPLFAYERSLRFPNGHRNLVWARRGVRSLARSPAEEEGKEGAARLYEYLRRTGGLAMSHTSATLMGTDWRDNDKDLEPLVEIYQGDRTSYEHEGAPRAARGAEPFTQPGGYRAEGFVWNAWAKGYKLGVQASSDHASTHVSYAVLLAEDHTRPALLKAIASRHAYAATDNILVDFRAGDHIQGDIFQITGRPKLSVRIEGTAPVDTLEIVRNNEIIHTARPGRPTVRLEYEDTGAPPRESWYYVRIRQADGQIAWSSPMWITAGK